MPDAGAEIYKVLRSKGYTPAQAAGVVGNARQESGLNPRAAGGGLFQGIGGRSRLGVGNARQQVETALREEPAAWKALRRTHTPQEAARVFSQQFERPGIPMVGNRERYAGEAAQRYAGLPAAAQQAIPGPSPARAAGEPQPNSTFDQTAFRKASTDYSIGSLFSAKERKGNPLFETGILPTKEPSRSEFTTEGPEAQPQPAQVVKQGNVSVFVPPGGSGKTAKFGDKTVAGWIAPILQYARSQGWKGSVNSGFRSLAEQTRIYNSGVRPAAKPGTSNHEGSEFPRGAVDVSDAQQLARILERSPYRGKLVWAGAKDPVHFSHPHGGSY